MAKQPSRTTNRLHFTDLDPLRFEDLCLNLVSRIQEWKELNHFGRKGADIGVDIHAVQQIGKEERVWFIQCKRYSSVSKTNITEIIDELARNSSLPDKLLVIISCDLSRSNYEYYKEYSKLKGIEETEIWTATTLEAKLYKDYKDLLFVYFGVKLERTIKDNAARIRYGLAMEKKVNKDLINHDYLKDRKSWDTVSYEPYYKFISHKVFVHSVDDNTYPEYNEASKWFMTFFYNTYHNGLEFWLDAGIGTTIIVDKVGNWEVLTDYNDKRKEDSKYTKVQAMHIGRMPYYNIVGYKIDGDEFYQYPIIYCNYSFDGSPFESTYYKRLGIAEERVYPFDFEKDMEVKFPI